MKAFIPRDYQRAILAHLCSATYPRVNVWGGMGVGKTVCVLTWLDWLFNVLGEAGPALILAPLRVAQSTWPDEQRKWKHLARLHLVSITGTAEERRAALAVPAQVFTMNYDNLQWLRDELERAGMPWPFKVVVADESTRLKSYRITQGSKRAQVLGQVARTEVKAWVNLTGTPAPNGLKDLWGQAFFLDFGSRLGRSYSAFQDRWFAYKRKVSPEKQHEVELQVLPFAQEQIEGALKDLTITVRAADYLDLPPLVENVIEVDLPKKAKALYRELEREMFLRLETGAEVEAFNAASLTMKCLQLANGALYTDDAGTYEEIHDAKIQALQSVVEEAAGAPVLVAYHFKSDLARLRRAFPQGRWLDADPQTIRDWNAGRIPVLFAHPASAGHGISLQDGGNIIVFMSCWWDLEQHEQIIERIGPTRQAQSGYNRPVFVHRIIARGTVDKLVLARLQTKASVQSLLLDAMKEQR